MTAAQLENVKAIFHAARERPPQERTAFLADACGGDEQLRREVNDLLASDQATAGFMADSPAALALEVFGEAEGNADVGRTIGQYKLIKCIGSGGMGSVYLAERADQQFQMQVALKLIKRGMDTDAVLRRFHHERQILASLNHPNIARLLDGGTTDDGLPFFVMEYIEGERIDRYADERQLSVTERLELFRQVCGAVSYAHQHLVVHRDLKPSNIFVTAEGTPKLLDFGIAKIIAEDGSANTFATVTAVPVMTPEYASPEQIEGAPATTASDVYSLGAVLYQLLTRRPPFRLQNRTPQELERISTAQIERPSAVVERVEDGRRLRGDVDNIVLMAMRRETPRRYRSVEQLSEDIRRHLAGRPVLARPDTLSYRAGKFLQRNKLGVAAAALLLLSLVAGIVATTRQAHIARREKERAERRFNQVRNLAHSVLFDYHDAIRGLPGATKVREQLVSDALSYLDSLAAETTDDPALQRELAAGYTRIGDVRGGRRSASLGDTAGAVDSYTKALQIRETLVARDPADAQARHELARAQSDLGLCLAAGDPPKGIEHLKAAQALLVALTREQPDNERFQNELATTCSGLGDALAKAGNISGALEQYRLAAAAAEAVARSKPGDGKFLAVQLMVQLRLTQTILSQHEDEAAAKASIEKAVAVAQAMVAADPVNTDYQQGLIAAYATAAEMHKWSDPAAALEYYRKAAAIEEKLVQADPANAAAARGLADTCVEVAHLLAQQGDQLQALAYYNKAVDSAEKLAGDAAHPDPKFTCKAISARAGAAGVRARLGEIDFAVEECSRLTEELRDVPADPANSRMSLYRAEAYEYLGYAHRDIATATGTSPTQRKEHTSLARDMFRASLQIFDEFGSRKALGAADEDEGNAVRAALAACEEILGR